MLNFKEKEAGFEKLEIGRTEVKKIAKKKYSIPLVSGGLFLGIPPCHGYQKFTGAQVPYIK
jgi:hypothetical protein